MYCNILIINKVRGFNPGFKKGGWLPVGSVSTMSSKEPNLIKIK